MACEHGQRREWCEWCLRDAIRKHRDQRGDDRCVNDDYELYQALGEPIPAHACQLNAPDIMIEDCKRFIESRHDPAKPYLSPQRRIDELQTGLRQAIELEREECAKIAEAEAATCSQKRVTSGDLERNYYGGGLRAGDAIAAAIRKRR